MKKEEIKQKAIVELDLNNLANVIKEVDKNKELIGNWDIYSGNFNEVLLHRFAYLKGTYEALQLLGIVLDNIEYSLKFKYFITNVQTDDPNKTYCIEGRLYDGGDFSFDWIYSVDDIIKSEDDEDKNCPAVYNFMKYHSHEVTLEAKNAVKYYTKHFKELFQLSKSIK